MHHVRSLHVRRSLLSLGIIKELFATWRRRRMSDEARWTAGIDSSTPNLARMHDYFIGGKDNFAVDREAAEAVLATAPEVRVMAQEHQAFQGRVIRFLVEQGITQFIN